MLFLTDLQGRDVIWGKLAATSVNALYGLLAILPMLVIPLQLGGVAGGVVWRVALILLNTLFFSLALGMYISTINKDERVAVAATVGLLVLSAILPWITGFFLDQYLAVDQRLAIWVFSLSTPYAFIICLAKFMPSAPMGSATPNLWLSVALYHLAAWWLLWRAAKILPQVWQSDAKRGLLGRWQDALEQWGYGRAEKRRRHRARLLDRNPFLWHASRDRLKPWYVWLLLVSVGGTWAANHLDSRSPFFDDDSFLPACAILNLFFKVWVASEACVRLMSDRQAGALELLLSTPLSTGEIIHGQWLALRRQFLCPAIVMLAVEYYGLHFRLPFLPIATAMLVFMLDIGAIGWVSLWLGLRAKNTAHALLIATALVLLFPAAVGVILTVFFDALLGPGFTLNATIYLWCALGLVTDVGVGYFWARTQLRRRFRQVALK